MIKLYRKSIKYGLKVSDIYETLDCDRSEKLGDKLEKNWLKEIEQCKPKGKDPSLVKAISKTFIWNYMFYGMLLFLQFVFFK